jgi:CRP-like cAMP-binding protein
LNSLDCVVEKLNALVPLPDDAREALARLPYTIEDVREGKHLVKEGSRPTQCCILVEGFACRYKVNAQGGRQIVSFHVRGDILDLQHLLLETADHHVQTITPATVAWLRRDDLRELARSRPELGEALWKDSLIDASIFREWVLNVGRRDAKSRIAHMLCEFLTQCEAAGLGSPEACYLPMTQEEIGDATGLTSVHVNRMLAELTKEGIIERVGRELRVRDWERMKFVADFDPVYLHEVAA